MAEISGSTSLAQIGRFAAELVLDLWAKLAPHHRHVLDTGEAVLDIEVEGRYVAAPEETSSWLMSYFPALLGDEVIGVGIIAVDITGHKKAEEDRRQLAALIDSSGDAIIGVALGGLVTSWNLAAKDLFEYAPEEIIGQPISIITPSDRALELPELRGRLLAGGPAERLETLRVRRDGSLVEVILTVSPVIDEAEKFLGFLSLLARSPSAGQLKESSRRANAASAKPSASRIWAGSRSISPPVS